MAAPLVDINRASERWYYTCNILLVRIVRCRPVYALYSFLYIFLWYLLQMLASLPESVQQERANQAYTKR